jgi:hypothetical protein
VYTLANAELAVSVLDPLADRARFGTRYCTGGYIFQVEDARLGPLLAGKDYPDYPDGFIPYDGQGIPDAFNLAPLAEPKAGGPLALIIGIGLCDLAQDRVVDFCEWQVEQAAGDIVMRTEQVFQGFGLQLERAVSLKNRTLRSATRVTNTGANAVPIVWFPHPFYPQPQHDELCRFNLPVSMPENPGYWLAPNGFIARKRFPNRDGDYQALDVHGHAPLAVLQRHPRLGLVGGTTSYVPAFFPIWGNRNTFSWEPYFQTIVASGQTARWWVDYDF